MIAPPLTCVTVNVSPVSGSVSFAVTSKLTGVSCDVFITSSLATGASSTGVTVIVRVEVSSVPLPSVVV
ncbi:MAG: hypothetical protein D8M62_11450 [Proteobacteria bacterium]|nr:hypothetical protein [Pseudomonadota bacterium]